MITGVIKETSNNDHMVEMKERVDDMKYYTPGVSCKGTERKTLNKAAFRGIRVCQLPHALAHTAPRTLLVCGILACLTACFDLQVTGSVLERCRLHPKHKAPPTAYEKEMEKTIKKVEKALKRLYETNQSEKAEQVARVLSAQAEEAAFGPADFVLSGFGLPEPATSHKKMKYDTKSEIESEIESAIEVNALESEMDMRMGSDDLSALLGIPDLRTTEEDDMDLPEDDDPTFDTNQFLNTTESALLINE